MKYIHLLADHVKEELKNSLPSHFGLLFDGWTYRRLHTVAIFAEFVNSEGLACRLLLCIRQLPDTTNQNMENILVWKKKYGKKNINAISIHILTINKESEGSGRHGLGGINLIDMQYMKYAENANRRLISSAIILLCAD
jgi:hypothetical protein